MEESKALLRETRRPMRKTAQRQDMTFLAIVVVVLVVAVALFVGLRSLPKKASEGPDSEAVEEGSGHGWSEAPPAGGRDGRDPFRSPVGGAGPAGPRAAGDLKLVGIVTGAGEKSTAIIHSGKRRYYAQVGDRAAGYTVTSIGTDTATLRRDGDRITLVLRKPELQE